MAWIESHQTLKEHPKLYKLMDLLNINKVQAIGHLHLFWWWCVDYASTGVLKDFNDLQLARAAEWSGEPKMFCNALVTSRFLDRSDGVLTVHDWDKFTLHYDLMLDKKERQLEQTRERVRAYRERKKLLCNANVTQSNAPTKPNQTNLTKPNRIFAPPTVEEIAAYAHEVNKSIDPERFFNHYEARGWMIGKTKMRNWKACFKNWKEDFNDRKTAGKEPRTDAQRDRRKALDEIPVIEA